MKTHFLESHQYKKCSDRLIGPRAARAGSWLVVAAAVTACGFDAPGATPPGDPTPDARTTGDAATGDAAGDAATGDAATGDAPPAAAVVVGYWRMETDTSAMPGLQLANEVAGGNQLVGGARDIDTDVPVDVIPATGQPNIGCLASGLDMNGTIQRYPALTTTSVTVELWARTEEGAATIFDSGVVIIDQPNDLRVRYTVDDGGGPNQLELAVGHDIDGVWRHYAFTYDEDKGDGCLFIDGVEQLCNDGVPGRPLIAPTADFRVGTEMDGAGAASMLDELRISSVALNPNQLLSSAP